VTRSRLFLVALVACLAIAAVAYAVWTRWHGSTAAAPQPGSAKYEDYVEAFSIGLAAIDVSSKPEIAQDSLTKATDIFAGEPAAWANLGLLAIRDGRMDDALRDLRVAESLTSAERFPAEASTIQQLLGVAEQKRGKLAVAIDHFGKAVALEPKTIEALYRLAKAIEEQNEPGREAEVDRLMDQILEVDPQNVFILQSRLKAAVQRGDRTAARQIADRFKPLAGEWPPMLKTAFGRLEKALADSAGPIDLVQALPFLNLLKGDPAFSRTAAAVDELQTLDSLVTDHFVVLAEPKHTPAEPDSDIQFVARPLDGMPDGRFDDLVSAWLDDKSSPVLLIANSKQLRQIGGKLDLRSIAIGQRGLVPIDWNNDFHTDILLAGSGGLRFYQQNDDGSFTDVTANTKVPDEVLHGDYFAGWAADIDLDGDLDLVLARRSGPLLYLQNNFDGTWTPKPIFEGVQDARAFVWADLDNDGLPDAAILDSKGKLHIYANERSGHFAPWRVVPPNDTFLAIAANVYNDGTIALVALRDDGAIMRIAASNKRSAWQTSELARWDKFPASPPETNVGNIRLITVDLDNNGSPDLLVSTSDSTRIWLGDGSRNIFSPLAADLPGGVRAAVDLAGNGRLDLVGLDRDGRPFRLANVGKKDYHWQTVRPLANNAKGDNRINSFGIGGQVEVRTGTFFLKQPIAEPNLHFGLGNRTRADVVRIDWPNGTSQVEFATPVNTTLVAIQRLKGSCPFLFAWNGERFAFVTDFMWSTPLGMYINAQNNGKLGVTTEWVKIRGDQLVQRDNHYELRATANLWETHYFDHLALIAVDHPEGTELVVDERFSPASTGPIMYLSEQPRPLAAARNSRGENVSDIVSKVDGVYLDDFERGDYQGLAADHWVECELPADAARGGGPLLLLATGWIHPTDSSINFALEQGHRERPRDLSLEVPDGRGGWKVASDHLGFPAGKNKTMAIRLDGIGDRGVPHRFRLRTNMEIYWDALQIAHVRPDAASKMTKLLAETAELDYRGIVEMTQVNRSSPELPNYNRVATRQQVWRDLVGYHTRFGDIRELLEKIDDRYALLSAGDEIALRFKAPPGPSAGWKRDFIWISDGWVKDGDFNTRFGGTVLPLPSHDATSYDTPPGRLEDDPVYQKHSLDWQEYHTRYVTPEFFERGLRGRVERK
jgi:tetratricopeptide (TPR) repeat protein